MFCRQDVLASYCPPKIELQLAICSPRWLSGAMVRRAGRSFGVSGAGSPSTSHDKWQHPHSLHPVCHQFASCQSLASLWLTFPSFARGGCQSCHTTTKPPVTLESGHLIGKNKMHLHGEISQLPLVRTPSFSWDFLR